jgi:hypothetical protein
VIFQCGTRQVAHAPMSRQIGESPE